MLVMYFYECCILVISLSSCFVQYTSCTGCPTCNNNCHVSILSDCD